MGNKTIKAAQGAKSVLKPAKDVASKFNARSIPKMSSPQDVSTQTDQHRYHAPHIAKMLEPEGSMTTPSKELSHHDVTPSLPPVEYLDRVATEETRRALEAGELPKVAGYRLAVDEKTEAAVKKKYGDRMIDYNEMVDIISKWDVVKEEEFQRQAHETAAIIRCDEEKQRVENEARGIIRGRIQFREDVLLRMIENCLDDDPEWPVSRLAKELNVSIDEALGVIRSVRFHKSQLHKFGLTK